MAFISYKHVPKGADGNTQSLRHTRQSYMLGVSLAKELGTEDAVCCTDSKVQ